MPQSPMHLSSMEALKAFTCLCLLSLLFFNQSTCSATSQRQAYIVHLQLPESATSDRESFYRSMLSAINSELDIVYSYTNVLSGFAAKLTEQELAALSALPCFLGAFPDTLYELQTTHTPEFLGLQLRGGPWNQSNYGEGVVIGLLDTGIYSQHPSFSGDNMPPPPAKWTGRCDAPSCNNKLIGSRVFLSGSSSPTTNDDVGHGSHTASTAAGAPVAGAQVLGNAYGVATGMAPMAHVAMYKVCYDFGCLSSDILAGMDAAVADGVDVLSISIGGIPQPFDKDAIALGAFAAIEKGVFVSCGAGNEGPKPRSLSNEAPWILTVAASTMDRDIRVTVELGNGQTFDGESLYQPKSFVPDQYPLVYGGGSGNDVRGYCTNGSFDGFDVTGKIVVCDLGLVPRVEKGAVLASLGAAGMIIVNEGFEGYTTLSDAHVLPASHVSFVAGDQIKSYINSSNPTATFLFRGTILGVTSAPAISFFSSRGPSLSSPGILKPDIAGPGVNVLAAWPFQVGPPTNTTTSAPTFNIVSGTSMSTPHLSGMAALIKSAHPDWSPAAIKSAIMTTANVLDNTGNPILNEQLLPADLFSVGAGFVNPVKASDPGLVYDLYTDDYIAYLCGMGYTNTQVSLIARRSVDCQSVDSIQEKDLNYPSITVTFDSNTTTLAVVERTVTHVGGAKATYFSVVDPPTRVTVRVAPSVLRFTAMNQKLKFSVAIEMMAGGAGNITAAQGYLKWVSVPGRNMVRSPISVVYKQATP